MLFNSAHFILFFIIVSLSYYSLGLKGRQWLLLLASCYFYAVFKPIYILILLFTIVLDYFLGIYIENSSGGRRKLLLSLSLVSNIGILAFFKYFNFLNGNLTKVLGLVYQDNPIPFLEILLPIGLSFHTFQAMSYNIEVYRGHQKAEKNFIVYALYVMFYPQLVAGPIERPQNILPQLKKYIAFDWENVKIGLWLMAWGFFKKVVVADRLALYVDPVFANPSRESTVSLWLALLFYSVQIYCDFSGYSSIALGTARVMGIKLMENFKNPYFATTVTDFWRRWHISLSTWFRDYLYFPLGGNKQGLKRQIWATFLVFTLSGLWHGASNNFLIWGFMHGTFLVMATLRDKYWPAFKNHINASLASRMIHRIITFLLVSLAWLFFRNTSFSKAVSMLKGMFTTNASHTGLATYLNATELWLCLLLILFMFTKERFFDNYMPKKNLYFGISILLFTLFIYIFGVFNSQQFIYFQF